jgi:hypothetical protein
MLKNVLMILAIIIPLQLGKGWDCLNTTNLEMVQRNNTIEQYYHSITCCNNCSNEIE